MRKKKADGDVDAPVEQHARHGNVSPFRKSGRAFRPAALHDQHGILIHWQVFAIDLGAHFLIGLEYIGAAAMLQ